MNKAEYLKILEPIEEQFKKLSYEFWANNIDVIISFDSKTPNGKEYQVEINASWDDETNENILVFLSIDNGGWRAYFPVTKSFPKPKN